MTRYAIAILSVLICSCTSNENSNRSSDMQSKSTLSATDRAFVDDAGRSNNGEIQLSKLAVDRASDGDVKKFAQHMIDDHTKVGSELSAIASSKHLQFSTDLAPKHNQLSTRLAKSTGSDFDRQYMTAMVEDHVSAVSKFETEAKAAQDPDLKSFAADNLPTLRQHLEQARAVASKADGNGRR